MTSTSERDLWAEVLLLAIDEAVHGVPRGNRSDQTWRNEILRARDYITKPNRDFDTVCNLAGVDSEATRERLADKIANAPALEAIMQGVALRPATIVRKRIRQQRETLQGPAGRKANLYLHNGIALTIPQWARETGIKENTIRSRLKFGYTFAEAITETVKRGRRKERRADRNLYKQRQELAAPLTSCLLVVATTKPIAAASRERSNTLTACCVTSH